MFETYTITVEMPGWGYAAIGIMLAVTIALNIVRTRLEIKKHNLLMLKAGKR